MIIAIAVACTAPMGEMVSQVGWRNAARILFTSCEETVLARHLICRSLDEMEMNATTFTTRLLLLPLLALGLVFSGFTMPTNGAVASPGECCQTKVKTCCGMTCCETPTPQQQRPRSDQTKPSNERPSDGQSSWSGITLRYGSLGRAERYASPMAVPTSGSPSLITQHIRLQI